MRWISGVRDVHLEMSIEIDPFNHPSKTIQNLTLKAAEKSWVWKTYEGICGSASETSHVVKCSGHSGDRDINTKARYRQAPAAAHVDVPNLFLGPPKWTRKRVGDRLDHKICGTSDAIMWVALFGHV